MSQIKITVIGAGVVGLAVARELSEIYNDVLIIEKNPSFGQETSSRNSEVIHAGIYYPKDSLKAKTCVEGKELLYDFCSKNNIPFKKIGKLIVSIDSLEFNELERLYNQGMENGVNDLRLLGKTDIKKLEPHITAENAIYSPSTGILDSHCLMKNLVAKFKNQDGNIIYNTELKGIDKVKDGFEVTVEDNREGTFKYFTNILINSAGLNSDKVAGMIGLSKEEYRLKYCKGDYFQVRTNKTKFINRLIYPVPKKGIHSLGIHAVLDLSGRLRLGPDEEYVEKIDYNIDSSKAKIFYKNAKRFLPFLQESEITTDTSGIRPKLQGPNDGFRDFIIRDEIDNGFPRFINLIGIESPGLTGSISIAGMVKKIVKNIVN